MRLELSAAWSWNLGCGSVLLVLKVLDVGVPARALRPHKNSNLNKSDREARRHPSAFGRSS